MAAAAAALSEKSGVSCEANERLARSSRPNAEPESALPRAAAAAADASVQAMNTMTPRTRDMIASEGHPPATRSLKGGRSGGRVRCTSRRSERALPHTEHRMARRGSRAAATGCVLLVALGGAPVAGWAHAGSLAGRQATSLRALAAPPAAARVRALRLGEADLELAKCDMSVLAIHSLVRSTTAIIANGHFDPTPTLTVQDLVDISEAFNSAASSSFGWLAAALLLTRSTGILRRPLERDTLRACRAVLLVFSLAAPLSVMCRSTSIVLSSADWTFAADALSYELGDLPSRLAVLIGWRVFIAPAVLL